MQKARNCVPFERITLRLPRAVIEYVRRIHGNPKRWLEYYIVDWIRIDLENTTGEELAELFNLSPAFEAILG